MPQKFTQSNRKKKWRFLKFEGEENMSGRTETPDKEQTWQKQKGYGILLVSQLLIISRESHR